MIMAFRGCCVGSTVAVTATDWADKDVEELLMTGAGAGGQLKGKCCIRRFVITEKAPTRAFSWVKAATTAFTFKTLLRHYAKRTLTPR